MNIVDLAFQCPTKGGGTVLENLESTLVEVISSLYIGIVNLDKSDGLIEVCGTFNVLPWVTDEIQEFIVTRIMTKYSPSLRINIIYSVSLSIQAC